MICYIIHTHTNTHTHKRLAAVTGRKSSEATAARFFECQAQRMALRKTATDLEERLAGALECVCVCVCVRV